MEVEVGQYNQKYIQWLNLPEEIKAETIAPTLYAKELKENNPTKTFSLRNNIRLLNTNAKYSLLDTISLEVKNQMDTNQCWALAVATQLESYTAKVRSKAVEYSGRHLEYSTAKTFLDGINPDGHNREVDSGGNLYQAYAYLTSGRGPILEEDMPFENNIEKINLADIQNKDIQAQLKEFIVFPSIYKEKNGEELYYTNGQTGNDRVEYSETEIMSFRADIKNHIMQYGAVLAVTATNHKEFFSNQTSTIASKAYYCDDNTVKADHQIVIVGWDDNYEVTNFNEEHRPSSPGAWLVQNSYGTEKETEDGIIPVFDNGYLYISYEDCLIETYMSGVISLEEIDYDNIYQYDVLGANDTLIGSEYQQMYMANVYQKKEETSYLKEIGFYTVPNESYEIYINASNENLTLDNLVKVMDVQQTTSDYITVKLDEPIELTGEKFAVVIKYIAEKDAVIAPIESSIPGTAWETATSNEGESFGSFDGNQWSDLSQLQVSNRSNISACIKAFTINDIQQEDIITSEKYTIAKQEKQIRSVSPETSIEEFINNLVISKTIKIYKNNNELSEAEIVGTGMELRIIETNDTYKIIVLGDTNGDGKVTGTDLLMVKRSLVKIEELQGEYKQAGDINLNGEINLTDLLKIKQAICKIIEF